MTPTITEADTWRDQAACRLAPNELFFLEAGQNKDNRAKRLCAACPVTLECLSYAIDTSQMYGIWGGMSYKERRRWVRINRPSKSGGESKGAKEHQWSKSK